MRPRKRQKSTALHHVYSPASGMIFTGISSMNQRTGKLLVFGCDVIPRPWIQHCHRPELCGTVPDKTSQRAFHNLDACFRANSKSRRPITGSERSCVLGWMHVAEAYSGTHTCTGALKFISSLASISTVLVSSIAFWGTKRQPILQNVGSTPPRARAVRKISALHGAGMEIAQQEDQHFLIK